MIFYPRISLYDSAIKSRTTFLGFPTAFETGLPVIFVFQSGSEIRLFLIYSLPSLTKSVVASDFEITSFGCVIKKRTILCVIDHHFYLLFTKTHCNFATELVLVMCTSLFDMKQITYLKWWDEITLNPTFLLRALFRSTQDRKREFLDGRWGPNHLVWSVAHRHREQRPTFVSDGECPSCI